MDLDPLFEGFTRTRRRSPGSTSRNIRAEVTSLSTARVRLGPVSPTASTISDMATGAEDLATKSSTDHWSTVSPSADTKA